MARTNQRHNVNIAVMPVRSTWSERNPASLMPLPLDWRRWSSPLQHLLFVPSIRSMVRTIASALKYAS